MKGIFCEKIFALIMALSMLLTLAACGDRNEQGKAVQLEASGGAKQYEGQWEEFSAAGEQGTLYIKIPDGWACDVCLPGDERLYMSDYGLHIYPEGAAEGYIELGYVSDFGVCGTGLKMEDIETDGVKGHIYIYDDDASWTFIRWGNSITAVKYSVQSWFSEYEKQVSEIVETMRFEQPAESGDKA